MRVAIAFSILMTLAPICGASAGEFIFDDFSGPPQEHFRGQQDIEFRRNNWKDLDSPSGSFPRGRNISGALVDLMSIDVAGPGRLFIRNSVDQSPWLSYAFDARRDENLKCFFSPADVHTFGADKHFHCQL